MPSFVGSFCLALLFNLLACPSLLALIIWTIGLDVTLFTTSKTSIVCRIEFIHFLTIILVWWLILVLVFFFKNLLNFLVSKLRVSPSLHSLESWPSLWPVVLKAMFLTCFSSFSWSLSRFISSSCSLSLPNTKVVVNIVKSLDSEIAVTFGCHDLSKHLRILMFSFSLSKILPRLMRWLLCGWIFSAHSRWFPL